MIKTAATGIFVICKSSFWLPKSNYRDFLSLEILWSLRQAPPPLKHHHHCNKSSSSIQWQPSERLHQRQEKINKEGYSNLGYLHGDSLVDVWKKRFCVQQSTKVCCSFCLMAWNDGRADKFRAFREFLSSEQSKIVLTCRGRDRKETTRQVIVAMGKVGWYPLVASLRCCHHVCGHLKISKW